MENVKFYESPEVLFLDAQSEGVLCQSGVSGNGSYGSYGDGGDL